MAEARNDDVTTTLPQAGKVQEVCRQWLVHEDGAMAHELQNNEIDFHYGLNRKNRRTVREDIPIAKLVQSEEEAEQQRDRLMQLQALQAQAEEDARVALLVNSRIQNEVATEEAARQMADEEIARLMQEKEKKKYEKYLEKKKERQLKKQREKLEMELAQHSKEARLVLTGETSTVAQVTSGVDNLQLDPGASLTAQNGLTRYTCRVTPAGHIEDNGDFSDFYTVPVDADEHQKKAIQEVQDEELAKLLQDQEHKRSKAEVDKDKLRQIEAQDEQLARVIQEQEKLKLRKAKQKRQQLREQQRLHQEAGLKPSQTVNSSRAVVGTSEHPEPSEEVSASHLYRRNSYTRSISNSAGPVQPKPVRISSTVSRQKSEPTPNPPALPARDPPSYEDHKQRQMIQASRRQQPSNGSLPPSEVNSVERWLAESPLPQLNKPLPASASPPHSHVPPPYGRAILDQNKRGMRSDDGMPPSPSPPGSYHSEEDLSGSSPELSTHGNQPASNPAFNIAAAIDPTYRRRQHEIDQTEQTDVKTQMPFSRSLPTADDTDIEWDPGVRGSLRRPHGHWNPMAGNFQEIVPDNTGTMSSHDSDSLPEGQSAVNPWQPVQGQKRSTLDKSRKVKKPQVVKKDAKGSCKQQ